MRAVVVADIIRRTFEYSGYTVNLVRNYTDVGHLTGDNEGDADQGEDRMEKAAKRENLNPLAIADKYTKEYQKDIASLHVLPPTHDPKATEHITEMIEMVSTLLHTKHAYTTDYAVYFDISTYPEYTKLSGQSLDNLMHGTGHGSVQDPHKKNPSDFALWFFKAGTHKDALQTWKSPFNSPLVENGEGFPGWHIECSAMSKKYLGPTFDIHIGGVEHISIHHTNEIAQSTCANNAPYATYWLHNEHLLVNNGKMSKSEGTSYTVTDIINKGYDPLVLRYFFLQAHYRSKQNFTFEALDASQVAYDKLLTLVQNLPDGGVVDGTYNAQFIEYISDDFNVTGALSVVWELVKDTKVPKENIKATLLQFDRVLGLGLDAQKEEIILTEELQNLLAQRKEARTHKDWVTSDKIRDILSEKGYTVTDSGDEQVLSKK
jgi:cysteinyl-tRNA synthetase